MPCADEAVTLYFKIGFSNKDDVSLLAHKHTSVEEVVTFVQAEIEWLKWWQRRDAWAAGIAVSHSQVAALTVFEGPEELASFSTI